MTLASALTLLIVPQAVAQSDGALFDRELHAAGTLTYEDTERLPPNDAAPVWIEVATYRNPMDAWCEEPCPLERVDDTVWTGRVELGESGAWTATLERGPRALKSTEAPPAIQLSHDFALQVTAQLATTPGRCYAFCSAQARHDAELACTDAEDPRICKAGERVATRDACEIRCLSAEAFALRGTTWLTSGRQYAAIRDGAPRSLVAPNIELERIVDASGAQLDW